MGEAEQPGVQGLARECRRLRAASAGRGAPIAGARAIDRIADQRMAEMGEMNADLVGAAGIEAAFELRRMDPGTRARPDSG